MSRRLFAAVLFFRYAAFMLRRECQYVKQVDVLVHNALAGNVLTFMRHFFTLQSMHAITDNYNDIQKAFRVELDDEL